MKTKKNFKIVFGLLSIFFCTCTEETPNIEPECSIILPVNGTEINGGDIVEISVIGNDPDGKISEITISINNEVKNTCSTSPCLYEWNTADEKSGINTIKATVIDNEGAAKSTEVNVNIKHKPDADFEGSDCGFTLIDSEGVEHCLSVLIMEEESVTFTDKSTNNPTSWQWDFGDGGTSSLQNPSHTYFNPGSYTVSLTAINEDGSDTEIKQDYVVVKEWIMNVPCPDCPTVTDADGNVYQTVQIGGQCWMAENLKVGTRVDGILEQTDNGVIEKYCYNNLGSNCDIYGGLYQWDEMMQYSAPNNFELIGTIQGVCPDGWHIPTGLEIYILTHYFGEHVDVGGKLKESNTIHWNSPNSGATNESGYTALPSGTRNEDGSFSELGEIFIMWLSQTFDDQYSLSAENLGLDYETPYTFERMSPNSKKIGWAVRCIKDE